MIDERSELVKFHQETNTSNDPSADFQTTAQENGREGGEMSGHLDEEVPDETT